MLDRACTLATDGDRPAGRERFQFLQEVARRCIRFDFSQREKDHVRLYSFAESLQVWNGKVRTKIIHVTAACGGNICRCLCADLMGLAFRTRNQYTRTEFIHLKLV